jgi:20S proteasome alpha/beta subunit
MTVVVGAVTSDKKIHLAGDSFCGTEYLSELCTEPKVFKLSNHVAFGICGGIRSEVLIVDAAKSILQRKTKQSLTSDYFKVDFAYKLHDRLKNSGVLKDKDGIHQLKDSSYVLGCNGHLFYLDEDLGVWEAQSPYVAIGAGRDLAIGALAFAHKSGELEKDPKAALMRVLDVCVAHSPWVKGPYTYLQM